MEKLQFCIVSSNADTAWHVCVKSNRLPIFNQSYFKVPATVIYEFDDTQEQEHCISIEISGKQDKDTVLDSSGNIVSDSVLTIDQFAINGIDVTEAINTRSIYRHDFNGHGKQTQQGFYGSIGCNGTVEFTFKSPMFFWLLENM